MHFEELLDNGLLLRTVRDEADIVKYVDFNSIYNNPDEGRNTNILLRYLPGSSYEDYQLIEDPQTGQIAATTCLIPWEFQFEGVSLRAAQLEQVLSHPDYRRHGLIRILMKRFMQVVRERQCDFSFIWGIPYYYRQYGYSYAIEGNTYESLPVWHIPDATVGEKPPFRLRLATLEDIPFLTELYHQAMQPLSLSITRSPDYWRYLLVHAHFPVEMVENTDTGKVVGYIGKHMQPGEASISIVEHAVVNQDAALAVLRELRAQPATEIQINWPQGSTLARLARSFGSLTVVVGQWLFNITDPGSFLRKLAPVFERRLEDSDCAGLTQELVINLFRQAYRLVFLDGKLTRVDALGFVDSSMGADGGDLCIPPDAFVRLVLGFRTVDELMDAWPDIVLKPGSRHILAVLFPRRESYLHATYAYFG